MTKIIIALAIAVSSLSISATDTTNVADSKAVNAIFESKLMEGINEHDAGNHQQGCKMIEHGAKMQGISNAKIMLSMILLQNLNCQL